MTDTGLRIKRDSGDVVLTVGEAPVYIDETPFIVIREEGAIVIRESKGGMILWSRTGTTMCQG